MQPFKKFSSIMAPLPHENVDTDQIIPARFLKTTQKTGLGRALFHDWRYDEQGKPKPGFILNKPETLGALILLAGNNFGCGSSREHAPWALADFGFRALISTRFADIFRNNCLKNGIVPIVVEAAIHARLFTMIEKDFQTIITVDLKSQSIVLPGNEIVAFPIDSYSKKCLLEGLDDLGYLLSFSEKISEYERNQTLRSNQ
jgi:3-isopropylmalate/(R)-2-methylmalate dehydratase small subunit